MQGAGVTGLDVADHPELVRVHEEGPGPDRDNPGGQAVQAVDEIDRVRHDGDPQDGPECRPGGAQLQSCLGQWDMEVQHVDPEEIKHRPRKDLAGELGRRRHLAHVVHEPDARK